MKSIDDLTPAGRTRRLRELALLALERYELNVLAVRPLAMRFNALFRVDSSDGRRFVLRVNRPEHRSLADIHSELTWLAAIRRDTDLIVAEPVLNARGELVTTVEARGVPEPRHCALFQWIGGRSQIRRPSRQTAFSMGEVMARLHDHADRFEPPGTFTRKRLDTVWPHGVPDAVYGDEGHELFTTERRRVLRSAAALISDSIANLYHDPGGLRFLHADLHLGNVKVTREGLAVFDFDDSIWCYPAQDAGIALFYLQFSRSYEALRDELINGYSGIRPWPDRADASVQTFAAARLLELISAMGSSTDPAFAAYLPRTLEIGIPRLTAWLNDRKY